MFKASTSIAIRQLFVLILFFCISQKGFSQCGPCTSCNVSTTTGCTASVTSNSSASFTIGANSKLCITAGTYTGSLTVNNGGIVVIGPGAVFNPSNISLFPGGGGTIEIQAGATADLPAITMNGGGGSTFTLNNCGNVTCHGNILNNGSGNFLLNNNGQFISSNTFTFNGSTGFPKLCNSDTLVLSGMTINGTWPGVVLVNSGYLEVGGTFTQNGNGNEINLCPGSMLNIKGNWTSNGNVITKGLGDCAKIQVGGNSTCNGCQMQGTLDICDTTGSAPTKVCPNPKVDANTGTWSPLITFCKNCVVSPCAPPSVFLNDTRVCAGSCVNLIASVSGGTPPYSYKWSPSVGSASGPVSVCPTITTTYTLVVTDQAGATGSATSQVTVDPLPVVSASPNTILCKGLTTNLSASGGTIYSWSPSAGLSNPNISNPVANPTATTTYTVTVTDGIGCSNSATVTVTVADPPTTTISHSKTLGCDSLTIYIGYGPQSIILTANSTSIIAAYQWYLNGAAINGGTTKDLSVTAGGLYNVIITDANGCVSDSSVASSLNINVVDVRCGHDLRKVMLCHAPPGNKGRAHTICIGREAISSHLRNHTDDCIGPCKNGHRIASEIEEIDVDLNLYPNPAFTTLNVEILGAADNVILQIKDALGRELSKEEVIVSNGVSTKEINISSLQAGIYFLSMQSGEQTVVKKFVKE